MRVRENAYDAETNSLTYDLRQGLPALKPESVEFVYSSHFLEHLTFQECLTVVTASYQVMCYSGRFRAALPIVQRLVEDYVRRDPDWLEEMRESVALLRQMPSYMQGFGDVMSCGIYQDYKHKYFYDEENISALLEHVGFKDIHISEYDPEIDVAKRRDASFYVECRK